MRVSQVPRHDYLVGDGAFADAPLDPVVAPAATPGENELQFGLIGGKPFERANEPSNVLARLECPEVQNVATGFNAQPREHAIVVAIAPRHECGRVRDDD